MIAGILDLPPSRWRKPLKQSYDLNVKRIKEFIKNYNWDDWDWTKALEEKQE